MAPVGMSLEGRGEALGGRSEAQPLKLLLRHISTPIHSPGSQVAQGTRGGQGKVPPPCGHFLYYNCTSALTGTSVSLALRSVNDSCPQDMSCGRNCRNKFQTQPAFRKPTATGRFSSHSSWKKQRPKPLPQDKMLSIPKYCRNANQHANKKASPITPIRASSGGYKQ